MPVLIHALKKIEKIDNTKYDIVLMLQPTSPLRSKSILERAVKLFEEKYEAVWSISKIDKKFHEKKQLKLNEDGFLSYSSMDGKKIIFARQMLDERYIRNGLVYAFTRKSILKREIIYQSGLVL